MPTSTATTRPVPERRPALGRADPRATGGRRDAHAPVPATSPPRTLDKLIATGFLRMAPDGTGDPTAEPGRGPQRRRSPRRSRSSRRRCSASRSAAPSATPTATTRSRTRTTTGSGPSSSRPTTRSAGGPRPHGWSRSGPRPIARAPRGRRRGPRSKPSGRTAAELVEKVFEQELAEPGPRDCERSSARPATPPRRSDPNNRSHS